MDKVQDHLAQDDRGCHRGDLGGIIVRGQFDDIESNHSKGPKGLQEREKFPKGKASGFRSSNAGQ
jgi:hypothetical protein